MPNISREDKEWSKKVVEEYKDSTEALPAIGEPSGYEKRLIHGAALVNAGASISDAAKESGVPYNALMTYHKKGLVKADQEVKDEQKNAVRDLAVEGALKSAEKIIAMLDRDEMKPAEVIKANQVLTNTVKTVDKWEEGSTDRGDSTKDALSMLVQSVIDGDLRKVDKVEDAIDVSPPDTED